MRKHTCGRNEFELVLQTLGWTKALLVHALALKKRNVNVCLLRLHRKAYERSQQLDSILLSRGLRSGWLIKA